MKRLFMAMVLFCTAIAHAQTGTLAGKLLDKEANNQPLPFANVVVLGTTSGSASDFDGIYEVTNIPVGTYTIEISFTGYETVKIPNIVIEEDKVTVLDTAMAAAAASLDEVLIKVQTNKEREEALLLEQKKAVEIKQAIGAEELSRKGIGNVEQAVTKASGITKVASRGIFVRGLDERYNFLTLNNLPISPVNWETKTPSLDLFDSSIIQNIDINKIFYSSLYGDFAGATINVNTKALPTKAYTKISFSAGVNLQSIDNDFLTDKEDDNLHYLGFGGRDAREIPEPLSNENVNSPTVYEASGQDAINAFSSDWNTETVGSPIALSTTIENTGFIVKNDDRKIAYFLSASYGNSYNSKIGNSTLRTPNGGLIRRINRNNNFDFQTNSNFLFSIFDKTDKNSIALNYLFLRTTSNSVSDNFGRYSEVAANLQGIDSKFLQSTLHQFQITGKYKFENNHINYGVTYGNSNYAQPDNNVLTLEEIAPNNFVFSVNSGRLYKYYLDNESDNLAASLAYEMNFESNQDSKNTLKLGADFNTEGLGIYNRFILVNTNTGQTPIDLNDIDNSIDNIFLSGMGSFNELVDTRFLDINTDIIAGHVSYNHNFNNNLSLLIGTRIESFTRTVGEESRSTPKFEFDEIFFLPNFNLRYTINDLSNLRFAGSKTYTRPKNIEIANITRQNSVGDLITGNPNLENSDNYSLDLKYEIFPTEKGVFSVDVFAKYIDSPIERLVQDNESFIQTVFRNTDEALIYGAEFELRAPLSFILGTEEKWNNLVFGTNFTLMQSETNISSELQDELNLTNSSRRLQGASDLLLNADVTYSTNFSQNFESEFTFTFNTYSKRISAVGSGASTVTYDDEFEKPFNNLSFIWKNKINKRVGVSVKVNNILDDTYERAIESNIGQADVSNVNYTLGRSISLSLNYKL